MGYFFLIHDLIYQHVSLNENGFCLEADGGAEQLNQPSAKPLKIKLGGTQIFLAHALPTSRMNSACHS